MNYLITGTTTVVGVFGYPVAHSLSPVMHNAAFAELGLDWVYVPFAVASEALASAVVGVRALGIRGVNVTIPHKRAILSLVDRLTPEAEAIGSVNTVAVTADGILGHSTDGPGFLRALRERGFEVAGSRAVVLGGGGAARAVIGALAAAGVGELTIVTRHPERAVDLPHLAVRQGVAPLQVHLLPWDGPVRDALARADLLVNATPIGMAPHDIDRLPVSAEWLPASLWVYDLVYTPRETALLRAAMARGCQTIDGVAMLVYQGAEAFTLWTGLPAPVAVMGAALAQDLQSMRKHADQT